MKRLEFHTVDYVVMVFFLAVSSAIGVYYGCFKKQRTTEEYILGNRQIHLIPVALSLAVTFQSATSIIGLPSEVYLYDTMVLYITIGISLANVVQALVIVPLIHPLRLTSAYEYLLHRFQSRAVQLLGMIMGMLQTLLYVSVVLYTPALALEAVAGIPIWLSIVLIGCIGTLYTAIGGMRTVVWTDTFQFVILYGGLIIILVLGILKIGSVSKVFEISMQGDRTNFDEFSPDPRVRHTVWGCVIGGIFNWLPNCCNQSAIQRISSVKTKEHARLATLLNIPLAFIFTIILLFTGLVLYAYFVAQACDPLASDQLSNPNQIMIYFVMHVLTGVPGLAGIFLAAVFSGALSSLSSGINSMATNTLQDVLGYLLKDALQSKKTLYVKLLALFYGILSVVFAYLAQYMTGPVTQVGQTAFGAVGGPVVGIFFLGAIFPQGNKKGALVGGLFVMAVNMWIALGSFMYGNKAPLSKPVPTSGCTSDIYLNSNLTRYNVSTHVSILDSFSVENSTLQTNKDDLGRNSSHIVLYDLSYMWLGLIGFLVSISLGLFVSLLTGKDKDQPTDPRFIIPCLRRIWTFDESTKRRISNTENDLPLLIQDIEV